MGNVKVETNTFILTQDDELIIKDGVKELDSFFHIDFEKAVSKPIEIKSVVLPNSLEKIGESAFQHLLIKSIKIPSSVKEIGCDAFKNCINLEKVELSNGLQKIGEGAFQHTCIKEMEIPDSVSSIGEGAFENSALEKIKLPKGLKILNDTIFNNCKQLNEIKFSEGLEVVNASAFGNCDNLKTLNFPDSLRAIYTTWDSSLNFESCKNLERVSFPISTFINSYGIKEQFSGVEVIARNKGEEIVLQKKKKLPKYENLEDDKCGRNNYSWKFGDSIDVWHTSNEDNAITLKDNRVFLIDRDGCLETTREKIHAKETATNDLGIINEENYCKLKPYLSHKFIPHIHIVLNLPSKAAPLFYKNGNANRWAEIAKKLVETNNDDRYTMIKLSYILGVFSENEKESKIATKFIFDEIIGKLSQREIRNKFQDLPIKDNLYNKDSAQFFMVNYIENPNFLNVYDHLTDTEIDYTEEFFERFSEIKKAYPYKKVITRHDNERLTVDLVIKMLRNEQVYKISDERASVLAEMVGRYGYQQSEYEIVEKWYLEGLEIPKEAISLKIEADKVLEEINNTPAIVGDDLLGKVNVGNKVTYELLEKSNPLGAVIGEATNCCQALGGAGEKCMQYGMTKPNSSFLIFRNEQGKLLGQAWVWYDEESKTVCLDNIEVPDAVIEKLEKNQEQQKEFINCLFRVKQGFVNAMGKGKVKNVTIGEGHNDIAKLLIDNFKCTEEVVKLKGYKGYTDAGMCQYIIPDAGKEQVKDLREM